jgi:Fe-S oxidoreductase
MPVIGSALKWAGGISQKRKLPQFASETFRDWWDKRLLVNNGKPPVILWVDTFNNHFHPQVLKAAVEVLEAAGHQVRLPASGLCCGRPLYDFGMLKTARAMLAKILLSLRQEIRNAIPIVGLEPSCLAVFRDELKRLFPFDEDAARLCASTKTLSEFLVESDFHFPRLARKAIVHGHCHQKAVLKMKAERELYKRIGLEFEILDSGCCGMAGSFGFESEHYEISVRCGERVLLPSVRQAGEDILIVMDGFSCHEQVEQLAHRRPMHTAELLVKVLREGSHANPEGKEIHVKMTVPEMQEQSALGRRNSVTVLEEA